MPTAAAKLRADGTLGASSDRLQLARRRGHNKSRSSTGRRVVIVCALLALVVVAGIYAVAMPATDASPPVRAEAPAAPRQITGRIKVVPLDGTMCRQLSLDNDSGRVGDAATVPCKDPPPTDPREIMRYRYSGGRIDSIRDGFTKR